MFELHRLNLKINDTYTIIYIKAPPTCVDNDPDGYCVTDKERICSATDNLGILYAKKSCAKTCNYCHGMLHSVKKNIISYSNMKRVLKQKLQV